MLSLPASRGQLAEALRTGKTSVRPAQSVQVVLSGRIRPFVSVRDVALEIQARGLAEVVARVDRDFRAPVVVEFCGSSAKYLSVGERAVLCAIASHLGAAGALFASDDKTETFLRDQRRSKAHRALGPDSGATYREVFTVDLAAVEPMMMEEDGTIRPVREREGRPVTQVLLGGDSGLSLRDFFAVSALLKSKRASPGLDFLVCPGSRQTLEVLSQSVLVDLIASGARLVEPDRRVLTGELYPPAGDGLTLKTCDHLSTRRGIIVSPETLAFAVANGHLGDPRGFKRPVRVTVPRNLPTDDVLLIRGVEVRGGAKGKGRVDHRVAELADGPPSSVRFTVPLESRHWSEPVDLEIVAERKLLETPCAFVAKTLEDIRWLIERAPSHPHVRALIASHIPAATVSLLSGLGVLALRADAETIAQLAHSRRLLIPSHESWNGEKLDLSVGERSIAVDWLAMGKERTWTSGVGPE